MMHESKKYLVEHYSVLKDLQKDFRNTNLCALVRTRVQGNSLVDVGCGVGHFLNMVTTNNRTTMGIEPNPGMCELAQNVYPHLRVAMGRAEDIESLVQHPVDCITMLDVLEHVEHDAEQVQKTYRVLTPNGQFIVVVPAHPLLYGVRDKAMGHYRRYTKKQLVSVLQENGFTVESVRYWNMLGVLPYLFSEKVLKKPLQTSLRESNAKTKSSFVRSAAWQLVNWWLSAIESRIQFGFGLSLVCVARKRE